MRAFSPRGRLCRMSVDGYLGAGGVGDKRGTEQLASGPCAGLDSGQNALGCFGGDGGRCGDPLLNLAALRGAPTTWIGPPAGGSPPSTAIGQPAQSCL